MRQIIKLGLILMLFAGVSAAFLGLVYKITKPKIEAQRLREEQSALKLVYPEAERYEKKQEHVKYYNVYDKADELIGYVLNLKAVGYGGDILLLVGFTLTGEIKGMKILEHQETPGLGASITKEWFQEQYRGKSLENLKVVKQPDEKYILSITGATISSEAVTDIIKKKVMEFLK